MSAISKAIFQTLSADPDLAGTSGKTALLAKYDFGDGPVPAVFTVDPAPSDAVLPYIVTAGEIATIPADTKTTRGRRSIRDIRCYTAATGSTTLVDDIAEAARSALHRKKITVDGFTVYISNVQGPQLGATEADAYGRIVTAHITMEEA